MYAPNSYQTRTYYIQDIKLCYENNDHEILKALLAKIKQTIC